MENTQTQNGDAFARTADALANAADSLALEFQRRQAAEVEQRKKDEQASAELRQKLEGIHQKIGTLLGVAGTGVVIKRRGRPVGSKNKAAEKVLVGRQMSEETIKAKDKVLTFITANEGVSRGDIAKNTKLDTSLVGRVLQMLSDEGSAKMVGERRGAKWSARKH